MLICLVSLPPDTIPFFSNNIVLWLYWLNSLSLILYPWCSIKYCVHNTYGRASLAPTNSVSVEIFVLILCFYGPEYNAPYPSLTRLIICPVCLRMSICNPCAAFTHHFTTCISFASSVSLTHCFFLHAAYHPT